MTPTPANPETPRDNTAGEVHAADHPHLQIGWMGHATADIRLGGSRVISDPILRDRMAHLRRHDGTGELDAPGGATPVDVAVISHLHHDHLDLPSIRRLPSGTLLAVPRGAARLVAAHAPGEIVEMSPEDEIVVGDIRITAVPADHHAGRFMSRVKAPPLGYLVSDDSTCVYFAGDTDLHPVMGDLPSPDVALLPIWGWGRTLGSRHLDPGRAAEAAGLLRASAVLPVHWGTFAPIGVRRTAPAWLRLSADVFSEALRRHSPETHLNLVRPGPELVPFPR